MDVEIKTREKTPFESLSRRLADGLIRSKAILT